ncbi:cytochrome c oxidase subunit III [Hymenobacter amundsenii]|uniref:Cytochrome c oxidase subunit III n=1 Tax=Hymenobacter amundsenii TaxID=2006685 RepID=A0A246FTN1_9BACT|nr:cytochrome c oxidase subunit III [Hymenobacter amundsenii]OWP65124.1 cytochrome c oxidase subunit III [Hymenobacter amundsenii]
MSSDHDRSKKVGSNRPISSLQRMERVPPMLMLLYVGLVGTTVLFAVLVGAYVFTRLRSGLPGNVYPLPRFFSLSTIVLLISSYVISQARRLYDQDDLATLRRCLGATLLLSSIFAGLQVLGWRELMAQGVFFDGMASGTFVYLISALHVAHLLGGMLFLLTLLLRTHYAERDAVRSLVFIRNPYRRLQLRIITIYWHFIDGLWIALFAAFLFLY